MSEEESVSNYLQRLATAAWPRWTDLPQFDLYMDQVVQFVNDLIAPAGMGELTPTMINNYVKKGIIAAPQKKKYTRGQLANIIVVAILKPVFSLDTISSGIEYQLVNREAQQAYDAFILSFTGAVQKAYADFGGEIVLNTKELEDTTVVQSAMVQFAINAVLQKMLVESLVALNAPKHTGKKK
mgnify:CR=1 FL=1